ncbi:hypothetical protein LX32DRAFT_718009 [Colletotrichum zoysiae]|uniref:BRCT domain-containing protein n=1 Tax=Colletotrichum zoysiae TaxID=1216348 RepID=A0AAD9HIT9_9PEZI|nr:hypothetical protein LX32DRAFT_718009 [Colletotrichum zoysiae]
MVRGIFKNLVIAAAGNFPDDCPNEQAAMEWTKLRKGRFSSDLDDSVTHLVCTDEDFKDRKKNRRIKQAEKGKRKIHIVSWDWFRFSCTHNKKLREKHYDFSATRYKEKEKSRQQLKIQQKVRNATIGQTWMNPDLYRIFTDKTLFEYKVDLFRTSEDEYGALHEKYELYLFESHAKPRLYWFGAKLFHKKDSGKWQARGVERTSLTPGLFNQEFQHFVKFFELKTSVRWWDRVIKTGTREKIFFNYSPPICGKPVGGSMKGDLYDKCVWSNKRWLRRWAELFGDELPANLQIEDAAKKILDNADDEVGEFLEAQSRCGVEASDELHHGAAENIINNSSDSKAENELNETTSTNKETLEM